MIGNVTGTLLNKWTIGGSLLLTGAIFVGFASERSWMTKPWCWTGRRNWTWGKTMGLVPLLMVVATLTGIDPFGIELRSDAPLELPM